VWATRDWCKRLMEYYRFRSSTASTAIKSRH
jgi:hypothetical protein